MNKFGRIALKTFLWILGSVIALILLVFVLIRVPAVQNYVVRQVTQYLENKIQTPVRIGQVRLDLPKKLVLKDVYFEDQSRDTLIAGESLKVDISMLKLLNNIVEINEIDLQGITAKINRTLPDSLFNFDYIIQAFASGKEPNPADTTAPMVINIDKVNLDRIRFVYHDEVIGTAATVDLRHLSTRIKTFDLSDNMHFAIPNIRIDGLHGGVQQWQTAQNDSLITPIQSEETASLLPKLEFENLKLSDINFGYADTTSKMDTRFRISGLDVKMNQLDLNAELVDIQSIKLSGSDSHVLFGKTAPTPQPTTSEADTSSPLGWKVWVKELQISDTDFTFVDDNQPNINKGFDYGNIGITELNGDLSDFYFSADTIRGQLKALTAKDRSGFQLDRLESNFSYTDQGAELADLFAETPHTRIRDYIRVQYESLATLADQIGQLQLTANLDNSHLGMTDVLYFVPYLDTMEVMKPLVAQTFHVDGRIEGRVDNLTIPRLSFRTLDQTRLVARARIQGLPDIDKLKMDLDIDELTTGRADLDRLVAASLLPDSIQLPENIRLAGTFNGGLAGFSTDMTLQTSEGNAAVDAVYQINPNTKDTTYNGSISIAEIDIGKIMKMDSTLGKVSFSAHVDGRGINPATAVASINGALLSAEAMGYTYRDIEFAVDANNGEIKAEINSDDSNIDFQLQAFADLRGANPKVRGELMVDSVNLKNLNLMTDDFRYHGKLTADFETAYIDSLNGDVKITGSSITFNDERYTLDTISIRALAEAERTLLQLRSEFLNAHFVGRYKISELSASVQDIIAVYYNVDTVGKSYTYSPQRVDFSAQLVRSPFIAGLLPDLTEMNPVSLDGSFNSDEKMLFAKLTAPKLVYAGTTIDDVTFDISTVDSTLYYTAVITKIGMGNVELINTLLSGTVVQNSLDFGLWIKDNADKDRYHLGMALEVDARNFLFRLKEDGLMLNYDNWDIHPENAIMFGTDGIQTKDFVLSQNGQEMILQSQDSLINAPIDLTFKNFRIETLSQMLESEVLNMGGGINGTATVSRLESSPVFVSDLVIDDFQFGNQQIGDISLKVNNERENTFAADIKITGNGNQVSLTGDFVSVPNSPAKLDFVLDVKPLTMKTLEAFSLGYLRNTAGGISGNLKITGSPDLPVLNGNLTFDQASMNVSMLNATFHLDKQSINFSNSGLRFNRFEMRDNVGNLARLNGTINTKNYRDFAFGLTLTADDFQVLNSTQEDNDLYYGKLFISSNLRVRGTLNNPIVDGTLRVDDATDVTFVLPNEDPGIADRQGIVKFVNRSDTARANVFAKIDSLTTTELSGINLSVNLETDPNAAFTIVIDAGSEDALLIKGDAKLSAGLDPSGNITLTGTYTVSEGNYSFSFGPVKRLFAFKKGSTIVWSGDPMDGRLDITAVYTLKAPTLELVQNQIGAESPNLYKQRIPFDVNLGIAGQMLQPELSFDIDMDENGAIVSQDVANKVNTGLSLLRENESEMNKQIFSLIVLGRFMASNPFESVSGGGVESMARNSVSSLLSSQLNRLASDLIKGVELDFDLESTDDYTTGNHQNRTDLNIGVSRMFFDDRLKVTVGSNFGLEGNARPGEQTTNIAGDVSVDYQLSRDGRYFVRAYRKNQYQVTLQGQFVETGLGFIINMDYDEFREIFASSKKLADAYNTDTREFGRRFDRERMEVDSNYRDSVRRIIRDSLERVDPEFRERLRQRNERIREERQENEDSQTDSIANKQQAIRDEQEYVNNSEKTDDE